MILENKNYSYPGKDVRCGLPAANSMAQLRPINPAPTTPTFGKSAAAEGRHLSDGLVVATLKILRPTYTF